jgi:hypothetical protein
LLKNAKMQERKGPIRKAKDQRPRETGTDLKLAVDRQSVLFSRLYQ